MVKTWFSNSILLATTMSWQVPTLNCKIELKKLEVWCLKKKLIQNNGMISSPEVVNDFTPILSVYFYLGQKLRPKIDFCDWFRPESRDLTYCPINARAAWLNYLSCCFIVFLRRRMKSSSPNYTFSLKGKNFKLLG